MNNNKTMIAALEHKPMFRLVRFNETKYYPPDFRHLVHHSPIYSVYFYDSSVVTLCLFTPSYELHYVESYVGYNFGADDKLLDYVDSYLDEANKDEAILYMNCGDVDKMKDSVIVADLSKPEYADSLEAAYQEIFDEWYEYVRCNQMM